MFNNNINNVQYFYVMYFDFATSQTAGNSIKKDVMSLSHRL